MRAPPETIQVLHVDDEPHFSEMVAKFLTRQDERFDVDTAASASDALDRLAEDTVDCVVSDFDMPGRNGIEFLEAVREDYTDLPFILYTGKGSEEVASEAISAGVTEYLQKAAGTSQYEVLAKRIENAVERQRAHETAAETEQRLQTIAENTNDILWKFTADWDDLLFINSPYEEVWGRSIDELRKDPQSFLGAIHPADRPSVEDGMSRLSAGESVDIEYRVEEEGDDDRWVWVQGEPVEDETGGVTKVVGFARDITARKERERELAAQRADLRLFEQAVEASTDLIGAVDTEYNLIFANERHREFHGLVGDDIVGKPAADVIGDPWEAEVKPRVDRALAGEAVQFDMERTGADGDVRSFDIRFYPIPGEDDSVVGVVGAMRDITERKERQRRFEAIFNNTFQFTGLLEPDGTLIEANQTALDFGGLDAADVVGEKLWEAYWFQHSADTRERARTAVERAADGEFFRQELPVQGADEARIIDFSVRPVTDDQGTVTSLIPEGRDMTERTERD